MLQIIQPQWIEFSQILPIPRIKKDSLVALEGKMELFGLLEVLKWSSPVRAGGLKRQRSQKDDPRAPKGPQRTPEGSQNDPQGLPKWFPRLEK